MRCSIVFMIFLIAYMDSELSAMICTYSDILSSCVIVARPLIHVQLVVLTNNVDLLSVWYEYVYNLG